MSTPVDISTAALLLGSASKGSPESDSFPQAYSAWRVTLAIAFSWTSGMLLMFMLLNSLSITSPVVEAAVGSLFMMVLMIPTIYLILFRPIRRELRFRARTTLLLREASSKLEDRVRERTVELEHVNLEAQQSLLALERTHRENALITELLELLQACSSESESQHVIERFGPKLFSEGCGALYLYRASRNQLKLATSWGVGRTPVQIFSPEDCWALRRGREHIMQGDGQDVYCQHILKGEPNPASALCVPLIAQGEASGLLVLEGNHAGISAEAQTLATMVAERIALALANLQLREKLRDQAIRDPLTAMFNRRYFEETATRELLRAGENGSPVGIIMIDVDHFKRFNDSHGHDAGDAVLQRVGLTLQSHTRVEDVICRYGGEEFVMLLPGLPADAIVRRAEELRECMNELSVRFHGETLGRITISCGISVFPDQGRMCAELIDAADQALYRAKQAGRNRVEVAA
jgi:diguanylate cyclase (GGDEF)-like protein